MIISKVTPGSTVRCGTTIAKFIKLSGPDALVELRNGTRVIWTAATEVDIVEADATEDRLPKLKAELARLEQFAIGTYAPLGVAVDTPCAPLPIQLHNMFVTAALGARPEGAILCRRCNDNLCIRADHLFWGTRSDCQRDMCLRGVARPSGKKVTALEIALRVVKLRKRIAKLEGV